MFRCVRSLGSLFLALFLCARAQGAETVVQARPDRESGIYDPGQTVTWSVAIETDKTPAAGKFSYSVKLGGLEEIAKGEVELADGKGSVTGTRGDPGALLLEVRYKPPGDAKAKEAIGRGGAVFGWEKIAPSAPPPDDFDKFWADKIAALNAIPMNAKLEKIDVGQAGIEYYKITLDNLSGSKIQGQIAFPTGGTNLPAMLQVQYAGVYKLDRGWVLNHAKNGWLALNISAHDLPIDEAPEFYKKQAEKELNDYPGIGNDDRETAYFLRMFLSCHRGVEYLTLRPEWNKKTLLVQGGSQGGYQAIVTAGLHPAVTAFAANVPAGCDHTGKQAKRAPGWPNWAGRTWQKKDYAKMLETSRYFDAMNFAGRAKCPALVGVGLIDTVCPPEGVFAAFNKLQGPKKIVIMPRADHMGKHDAYYGAYWAFLEEHRKKVAEAATPEALMALGKKHFEAKNYDRALECYRKAADKAPGAQFNLGLMYATGAGVVKDEAEAVRWYRMAADQGGFAEAQVNLGVMYANGAGVAKDEAEAVRWYRSAAEKGNAAAQCNLGVVYDKGRGVTINEIEAVRWYGKAAEQGDSKAQFNLARMYQNGRGVVKDEAEAIRWYRKAADQGLADAELNLGTMYGNGLGVAKNEAEAVRWYRKAADQGLAGAQFNLGLMYANGTGVVKDETEAVRWFRKAGDQGYANAQSNLGVMYTNGIGTAKDEVEGARWFQKAADQGNVAAQHILGVMYANGRGVAKDEAEAVRWYRKAAAQGYAPAMDALKKLNAE